MDDSSFLRPNFATLD